MKRRKIKSIKKRIILFVMILSMVMPFIPANAITLTPINTTITLDSGKTVTLTKAQLDEVVTITSAEAEDIAVSFVNDMIAAGIVEWNENTAVTSVVPMYDNTDTNEITAYTVNLTTGYIVVSAYLDAESLIPEWSDKAAPLYQELDVSEDDKVIYLGGYEYYADNGTSTVKDLNDIQVQKTELTNLIEETRDLSNIPDTAVSNVDKSEIENVYNLTNDGTVIDPIGHGNANYIGPFKNYESDDGRWNNYIDWYTMDYGSNNGYTNHCGPTSITNAIAAYRNRYPAYGGTSTNKSNDEIFKIVADYGIANNYYSYAGGTKRDTVAQYTLKSFHQFNMTPTVTQMAELGSYDVVKTQITTNNNFLRLSLYKDDGHVYGDHGVLCYGYNRLRSDTNGYYLTYLEIADGWNDSPRYLLLAPVLDSHTTIIDFT